MNNEIKEILVEYYKQATDIAIIPHQVMSSVLECIIKNGTKRIIQFVYFENAYSDETVFSVLKNYANKCEVIRIYGVKFLKQLQDDRCAFLLDRDAKLGIKSMICALSKAKKEELPEFVEFILFDNNVAIVNRSILDMENIYTEDSEVIKNCKKWEAFAISQSSARYSDDFLQEPLMQSADMLFEAASVLCSHDHINADSCQWYHSIWQYLRLLDMVSTPSWHHDFYCRKLLSNIGYGGQAKVLISGTADYSMLAYVYHTAKGKSIRADVSVLDLCDTPIFACKWYANKLGKTIVPIKESIFLYQSHVAYDMICADAFLTRFTGMQLQSVLNKWHDLLRDDGIIVTTVRIHDEQHICPAVPTEEAVQLFKTKAIERMEIWGRHINLSAEELGKKAENYARTMVSNCLGSKEHILDVIAQCGLKVDYIEDVEVQGELYPSRYLRLVLKKELME